MFEQFPLQFTNATFFSAFSTLTPSISPNAFATFIPPTVHPFTGASPFTTASEKASHPGKPHPPQLAPGKASRTFGTLGSTSIANLSDA
ncbi:hypothetical protein D3C76_627860 [compost metagenome]